MPMATFGQAIGDLILVILAIILPPLPVLIRRGCSAHFFVNVFLTIFGWIPGKKGGFCVQARPSSHLRLPGILHAWYVILVTPHRPKCGCIAAAGKSGA